MLASTVCLVSIAAPANANADVIDLGSCTNLLEPAAPDTIGAPITGHPSCPGLFDLVPDSTPPSGPTFSALDPASPSNLDSVTVAGQAEPGAQVSLYAGSGCVAPAVITTSADVTGAWSAVATVPHDATTIFHATAADAAGNVSECAAGPEFVEDMTAPEPPFLSGTVPVSPSPAGSARVVGIAEPGSTVSLYSVPGCAGVPVAAASADELGSGGIAFDAPEEGTTNLYAVATDAAGNRSACAGPVAYTRLGPAATPPEPLPPPEPPTRSGPRAQSDPPPPLAPIPAPLTPAPPAPVQPDPAAPPAHPAEPGKPRRARTVVLSNERTVTRWAHTKRRAVVRRSPRGASKGITRLHHWNEDYAPEIYLALRMRVDTRGHRWVQLRLPMRPNGTVGWVPRAALGGLHVIHTRLVVNTRTMRAALYRNGHRRWMARVGVGKPSTPTPSGRFWIRDLLRPARAGTIYGPFAFGTSAYSILTDWPGGGVVGIHGTDEPGLIPGRPSHGCVRIRNRAIRRLARLMPLGTPVLIR